MVEWGPKLSGAGEQGRAGNSGREDQVLGEKKRRGLLNYEENGVLKKFLGIFTEKYIFKGV